jgi:catechol 2,3-dioxygenase
MPPKLSGIDHVHVYVGNWPEAEAWYESVLGFKRLPAFEVWAVDGGPLTLEDASGTVHLALFESQNPPTSTIAFGASGEQFLAWKSHLEQQGLELRVADHDLAWSMYFHDPFGNYHEITSYEHEWIREHITTAGIT